MRTSDAFYLKQMAYTFAVPCLVVLIVLCWLLIAAGNFLWNKCGCAGARSFKFKRGQVNDYMTLSIVLMLFLAFPMLTRLCLGMLKCPTMGIGGKDKRSYLFADLQEPCFEGRHLNYVFMLTVPQLLLNVIGLPVAAAIIVLRNKKRLHEKSFYTRYGLLYMGYRPGREWWELVIAMRKVAVVSVGTFGTMLGVVDLQAFLALGIVFVSILVHLAGQPFNVQNVNSKRLHDLEFVALNMSFFTFWGGLLFFLGHEKRGSVSSNVQMMTSFLMIASNTLFLVVSLFLFIKTYLYDRKFAKQRKRTKTFNNQKVYPIDTETKSQQPPTSKTGVVDRSSLESYRKEDGSLKSGEEYYQDQEKLKLVDDDSVDSADSAGTVNVINVTDAVDETSNNPDDDETLDFDREASKRYKRRTSVHSNETIAEAHAIHDTFHDSEMALQAKHQKKQQRQRRATQNRVMARSKIRRMKALNKVPIFSNIPQYRMAAAIESILELTTYKKATKDEVLCQQGDAAIDFYIIVTGQCNVQVKGQDQKPVQVGQLKELDFFGESALLGSDAVRNATVIVESETMQVLKLSRGNFQLLVEEGVLTEDVLSKVEEENEVRKAKTRSSIVGVNGSKEEGI